MKVGKTFLRQVIKEEIAAVLKEIRETTGLTLQRDPNMPSDPIDGLVYFSAQKGIMIIDRGLAVDDDPAHLKVLREVFENILEYDKNEMVDYLNDYAKHIKTPSLRRQLTTIAAIFQNS